MNTQNEKKQTETELLKKSLLVLNQVLNTKIYSSDGVFSSYQLASEIEKFLRG